MGQRRLTSVTNRPKNEQWLRDDRRLFLVPVVVPGNKSGAHSETRLLIAVPPSTLASRAILECQDKGWKFGVMCGLSAVGSRGMCGHGDKRVRDGGGGG